MSIISKRLSLGFVATSMLALATIVPVQAGIEGNVGLTSNYFWRGMSQTADEASVSGGLDYSADSGFYLGTWVANVDFGETDATSYELDLYGGYSGEISGISYDVGYISYLYPDGDDLDFAELYLSVGFGPASITYYDQIEDSDASYDKETSYVSLDIEFPVDDEISIGLHYGMNDITNADQTTAEQDDFSVTVSKGDFSLGLMGSNDIGDDDTKAVISYGISF
jgi:uncharacterized protein (TIGR02001 family)